MEKFTGVDMQKFSGYTNTYAKTQPTSSSLRSAHSHC